MLEKKTSSTKWITFAVGNVRSQCCRCYSSLPCISSCLRSSHLNSFKRHVNKLKKLSQISVKSEEVHNKKNQARSSKKTVSMDSNLKKPPTRKLKLRSISVEDLGSVVKQMIEGALKDDEENTHLQRAVYGDWYFQNLTRMKAMKLEAMDDNCRTTQTESAEDSNVAECHSFEEENVQLHTKSNEHNFESNRITDVDSKQSDSKQLVEKLDRVPTFISLSEKLICEKDTEKEEKKTAKKKVTIYQKPEEAYLKKTVKKIIRSKLTKNPERNNDRDEHTSLQRKIQNNGDFTFDAWKQEKNETYKRLIKEERAQRHRELAARAEKIEREKTAQETYLQRQREQVQRKLKRKNANAVNETTMTLKDKADERRWANMQAFKEWKKRKDAEMRMERIKAREYYKEYYQMFPQQLESCIERKTGINFDTWLDQLDNVLHQKYMRERRYRVGSFYCQPTRYGTAALNNR